MKDLTKYLFNPLLIIGGLNWGLLGLLDFNLVAFLFGGSIIARIIYILVGISAAVVGYQMYFAKTTGKKK